MIDNRARINQEKINQKRISENTFYYIKNYLNPDKRWDGEIVLSQRITYIRSAEVNWEIIFNHIKNMEYQSFLKTPYWKTIADYTKYKAGYRCQLCNSSYDLVTHHRSYNIHGREHSNMHELIVLCDSCHSRFHNKTPKSELDVGKESSLLPMAFIIFTFTVFLIYFFSAIKTPPQPKEPSFWDYFMGKS